MISACEQAPMKDPSRQRATNCVAHRAASRPRACSQPAASPLKGDRNAVLRLFAELDPLFCHDLTLSEINIA